MGEYLTVVIAVPKSYTANELHTTVDHALQKYMPGDVEWSVVEGEAKLPDPLPEAFEGE